MMKSPRRPKLPKLQSATPMTLKIMALCAIVLCITSLNPELFLAALGASLLTPWGFITYQFAHAGLMHLVGNFLFGLPFMLYYERKVGGNQLLKDYLITGVGSAALFLLMFGGVGSLIGSSGSISGMAALGCLSYGKTRLDRSLGILGLGTILLLQLLMAVQSMGFSEVAYWGHVGGLLTGAAIWMMRQKPKQ